jgi:hypothetical protein
MAQKARLTRGKNLAATLGAAGLIAAALAGGGGGAAIGSASPTSTDVSTPSPRLPGRRLPRRRWYQSTSRRPNPRPSAP